MMIDAEGQNLIFILSTPRAGSTLLGAMLSNHRQVLCPPEPWLLLPLNVIDSKKAIIAAPYDHEFAQEALHQFLDDRLFKQATNAFATMVYNTLLDKAGKKIFVDKTPRYYHILPWIDTLFPLATKVWLKRNPLDVIASCKKTWGLTIDEMIGDVISPHSFDTTISFALLASFFETKAPTRIIISYEDLVSEPVVHLKELCDIVGLTFDKKMLKYGGNVALMNMYGKATMGDKKVLEHTTPHQLSTGRWRSILTSEEIERALSVLGQDIFIQMGYGDILQEAATQAGLDLQNIGEKGRLDAIFEKYTSYCNHTMLAPGIQRSLIAQENTRLQVHITNIEADRAHRLEVIQKQGAKIDHLHSRLAQTQDQLAQTQDQLAQTQDQLAQTQDQLAQTQVQLAQTQDQLAFRRKELKTLNSNIVVKMLKKFKLFKPSEKQINLTQDQQNLFTSIREPKHLGGVRYTPDTIEKIIDSLQSLGYQVKPYTIDVADYRAYFEGAGYEEKYPKYYDFNLPEKSLEHYIAAKLLNLTQSDVFIDIASEHSPVPEIYHRLYGCTSYKQDLNYPPGLNGDTIGGDAADMPIPDNFASKMTLHCSLEHFEGDSDIKFIRETERVLRPGGALCILPLYLFDKYIIQTDPSVSVPQNVQFEDDATVHCDFTWKNRHARFYDPAHLYERVHKQLGEMTMTIFKFTNTKEVDPSCYVEFAALITKS